jgi:methylenetetrahydrofolate dehydrogenase (NADP+)/methenyltetrahydrofolate cyclohydrolase
MIINGPNIAARVLDEVREKVAGMEQSPSLMVFTCAPNYETKKYLNIKKKKAGEVGIVLMVRELPADVSQETCIEAIQDAVHISDGIIVQLPFPAHIDRSALIGSIPASHDVDAFSLDDDKILPPVVGAMQEILKEYNISIQGKRVVVVGDGKLVGEPAARWLKKSGADVHVVTEHSDNTAYETVRADVIVLGAGSPGLLTPDMIKDEVVILDAGTTEEGGKLRGDANPACAEKASLFTPVPGGVGPITVSVLLRNLVLLALRKNR